MAIASKNATVPSQYAQSGGFPRYAIKIDGCNNVASGGTYTQSPFTNNMVVLEAYIDVETADSSNGTIDVGFDDDIVGDSSGAEMFNEFILDAGIWEGLATQAVNTTTVRPVWERAGATANSYLVISPGDTAGTGDADFNVFLVLAPEAAFE